MPQVLHRIRLQGPWDVLPPGSSPKDAPLPVEIPASWRDLFGESFGQATFFRRFNTPTGLEAADRLWIRLPVGCGDVVAVRVNQQSLEHTPADLLVFDMTSATARFNELEIILQFPPKAEASGPGGLWQPVLLEIVRLP